MISDVTIHLRKEEIDATEILLRTTATGDKYWVIKIPDNALIFVEENELRTLSDKIINALRG